MDGKNGNGKNGNGSVRSESDNGSVGSDSKFEQTEGAQVTAAEKGAPQSLTEGAAAEKAAAEKAAAEKAAAEKAAEEQARLAAEEQARLAAALSNDSLSGNKQEKGQRQETMKTVYDPVEALKKEAGMNNLNELSGKIAQQTKVIRQYNTELEKKFAAMRQEITDAVKNAEKRVGTMGLENNAVEAINTELVKVHKKIMGSIEGLETQVGEYKTTVDNAKVNKQTVLGRMSEGVDALGRMVGMRKKPTETIGSTGPTGTNEQVGNEGYGPAYHLGPKGSSPSTGGYKSTPRTRKHRKTYRFTATPKSQTMKKRHRTHKKAKKQAKKQNKQRK
jgi:hypothetical protein